MKKRLSVKTTLLSLALGLAATLLPSLRSEASGFAILEQSPRGIGHAFAGMAASNDDPGALFYNPATATWFGRRQIMLGLNTLKSQVKYSDDGSTQAGGVPITGVNGGDAGGYSFIPNLYVVQPLGEQWAIGLGITATSGTETNFDPNWFGRYHAIKTSASTIDVNPVISYKPNEYISFGFGVDFQYLKSWKTNAVDIGPFDVLAEVRDDSYAFGWSVGTVIQPREGTRLGLAYRSRIAHSTDGDARFWPNISIFQDTSCDSDMDNPAMVTFGLRQELGEKFALLVGVEWTNWSDLDKVITNFHNSVPTETTRFDYEDTWRYSLGLDWYANDKWTFRCGTCWDRSPVKYSANRTPRLPDTDRIWLTLGASYKYSETVEFDLGYMHIFTQATDTTYTTAHGDTLNGTFNSAVDILSVGVIWKY